MSSATKNANNMYHVYASLHQEEMAVGIFTQILFCKFDGCKDIYCPHRHPKKCNYVEYINIYI